MSLRHPNKLDRLMPVYEYRCPLGHEFEQFCSVALWESKRHCPHCTLMADQIISAPLLVKSAPDVCYDSPIDGRPITSMQARQEDLKRSSCRPYDPDLKSDQDRRVKQDEAALDQAIEATVEEAVTKMDGRTRGRLASELLEQGVDATVERTTPHA